MISSHEFDEEFVMVLKLHQNTRDEYPRNLVNDMMTFLPGNGYPQGVDREE